MKGPTVALSVSATSIAENSDHLLLLQQHYLEKQMKM